MAQDRFGKVYNAFSDATATGGPLANVALAVGLGELKGGEDALIAVQESEDVLATDHVRQTRTIGVRLVAVSTSAARAKAIMNAAVGVLNAAPDIRVFDRTGAAVDLEDEGPAPEGVFITSQRVDLR